MTYKNNFVVAIKVGGKVLRESGGEVELPFGSEYSVLLKNLNSVRAQAQISIDSEIAGPWYVLGPNESMEIERFNTTGNQERGNRFKFIERTDAVEQHRGVKAEDGLVRVEFKKEKVQPVVEHVIHHQYHYHHEGCFPHHYYPRVWLNTLRPLLNDSSPTITCSASGSENSGTRQLMAMNMMSVPKNLTRSANDAGITVPGSESNQKFISVSNFETEQSEVLTLKLLGKVDEQPVQRPVTVDLHAVCQTCGKRAKGNDKFCSGCGTALQII